MDPHPPRPPHPHLSLSTISVDPCQFRRAPATLNTAPSSPPPPLPIKWRNPTQTRPPQTLAPVGHHRPPPLLLHRRPPHPTCPNHGPILPGSRDHPPGRSPASYRRRHPLSCTTRLTRRWLRSPASCDRLRQGEMGHIRGRASQGLGRGGAHPIVALDQREGDLFKAPEPFIVEPLLLRLAMLTCAGAHQPWPCYCIHIVEFTVLQLQWICILWFR